MTKLDTEDIHDASRNIVHHIGAEVGDVEQGFAESDHVFEYQYYVHQVHATPIEPHIAISWWDSDERMVIRTSTQVPFHVRRMIAPLLGNSGRAHTRHQASYRRRFWRQAGNAD